MSTKHKIVIIGGGYAGMIAALRLAGKAARQTDITLINGRAEFVQRIRNHQVAAQQTIPSDTIPQMLGKRPVGFVQGWVTRFDPDKRTVTLDSGETIAYDKLVYALGSVAAKPDIPGVDEHAFAVADIQEAQALRARVAALAPGDRALIIGGGLTGIEMATELAESRPDLRVGLVTDGHVGSGLSERARTYIRRMCAQLNLDLQEQTRVAKLEARQLSTQKGDTLPFEVAIWAGAFGVPPLARQAGLTVNAQGRVQVDAQLRSISHPDVYAVGDSAVLVDRPPLRMACATAFSTGAHAADNLIAWAQGRPQKPFGFHYGGQCISLGNKRALVQWTDKDDAPQDRILTGLGARLFKKGIYLGMRWGMRFERAFPGATQWPGKDSPPAAQKTGPTVQVESY